MTSPAPLPPPPPSPRSRTHPLATAGLVLSVAGFAVPVVAGLLGALLGALALRAIAAEPDHWGGEQRAQVALGLGLLTGAMPLGVVLLVNRDDWGPLPVIVLLAYCGAVAALGLSSRRGRPASAGRAAGGAAIGVGGVVVVGAVLVLLVFAVIFLFQTTISGIGDAISDAACSGS